MTENSRPYPAVAFVIYLAGYYGSSLVVDGRHDARWVLFGVVTSGLVNLPAIRDRVHSDVRWALRRFKLIGRP